MGHTQVSLWKRSSRDKTLQIQIILLQQAQSLSAKS